MIEDDPGLRIEELATEVTGRTKRKEGSQRCAVSPSLFSLYFLLCALCDFCG
jgi:hypothetical protein